MRLNKDKHIGRVLFIVEGSKTEFVILQRIFQNILGYSYIAKKRNTPDYYISERDRFSRVAVINTRDSNIRDISDDKYLDDVFDVLREKYQFPTDQSAIYYLFDRDPQPNTNSEMIENYIRFLANPYDNEDYYKAGQLLLSYPSIESYIISNFKDDSRSLRFKLGKDAKAFIGENRDIQTNKISDATIIKAANEFLKYLESENVEFDIDEFAPASHAVFTKQEAEYLSGEGFRLFSMMTLALLQMGILEIE